MYNFFLQSVVIEDSDDSEYDDKTYVPDELEKDEEEEVGVFEDWAAKIEQCGKVRKCNEIVTWHINNLKTDVQ